MIIMLTWNSFKSAFEIDAATIIDQHETDLHAIRIGTTRALRGQIPSDRLFLPTTQIKLSFEKLTANYCGLLDGFRAIRVGPTQVDSAWRLSAFERGLYLDFLAYALAHADKISKRFEIADIYETDEMYFQLQKAHENRTFLWWKIEPQRDKYHKRGTLSCLKVYRADMPYLEFYHGGKRNFPWQRRAETGDKSRYAINVMGQVFRCGEVQQSEEDIYAGLIDWHLRERYWGINFAAELSKYAPGLNHEITDYHKQKRFWEAIQKSPEVLKRFMEIPYPAYRVSFLQSLLRWYFANEDYKDQEIGLRDLPIMELIERVGILLPKYVDDADGANDPKNQLLPKEITLKNLDELMRRAFYVSVLSCMESFGLNKMQSLGQENEEQSCEIEMWTMGRIDEMLENPGFWEQYKASAYRLFCDEIHQRYGELDNRGEKFEKRYPLILMALNDPHAERLLKARTRESGDRISDAYAVAYSQVQRTCYLHGLEQIKL